MCMHKVYFVRFSVNKFNRFATRQQKLDGIFMEAFNHPAKLVAVVKKNKKTRTKTQRKNRRKTNK